MSDVLPNAGPARAGSLSPAQLRAARAMLDWSMIELAAAARLSVSTIKRMETAQPQLVSAGSYRIVRDVLERAGIRFSADDRHGEGVWMTRAR